MTWRRWLLAAASVDDVGTAGRASMKAAGVVVDDAAVTPTYVHGVATNREIPIIRKIAVGSIRNKLLFILPAACCSARSRPTLVEVLLATGGATSAEGRPQGDPRHQARRPRPRRARRPRPLTPSRPPSRARSAPTSFLSAEIMVISLKEVIDEPLLSRAAILVVVAVLITVLVHGVVALIVKMDDAGLALTRRESPAPSAPGCSW